MTRFIPNYTYVYLFLGIFSTISCISTIWSCEKCKREMKAVFLLYELDERKDYEKGVIHGINYCIQIHEHYHVKE
jgi:hypothetical protein